MEVSAGMDVVAARRKHPALQMMGGIPKNDIALGRQRIDAFLEHVRSCCAKAATSRSAIT